MPNYLWKRHISRLPAKLPTLIGIAQPKQSDFDFMCTIQVTASRIDRVVTNAANTFLVTYRNTPNQVRKDGVAAWVYTSSRSKLSCCVAGVGVSGLQDFFLAGTKRHNATYCEESPIFFGMRVCSCVAEKTVSIDSITKES
jgi:hypothetical protein